MPCWIGARAGKAWRRAGVAVATLLVAGWAGGPATAPPAPLRLEDEIARQVERGVAGRLGLRGLALVRAESGEMLAGETRTFEVELLRGERFLALGACDEECSDLDLSLTDPWDHARDVDEGGDALPAVGAVIPRSGRHEVGVTMASCTGRCRFSIAFLVARRGDPGGRDRLAEARRLHDAIVDPVLGGLVDGVPRLVRLDGFEQPALGGGRQESFPVEIRRAGKVVVAAACDFGCEDLDLLLEDASGTALARDEHPDPEPLLWLEVRDPGTYRVRVRMEHCVEEPCAYVASVLAQASPAPVPGSQGREGTCFAVHPNGLVATAAHVVAGAASSRVRLPDGADLPAEIHTLDERNDLAVLRVARPTPAYLPLAVPDSAVLGLRVFTLGFPARDLLGEAPKFTDGVIASLRGPPSRPQMLQITVPVQPGNSGGPLVSEEGFVVGVVTGIVNPDAFRAATGSLPQSVNYAARSEFLAALLPPLADPAPPVRRAQAIERARAATCWVEAIGPAPSR